MRNTTSRDKIDAIRAELVAAFLEGRDRDYSAACSLLVTWLKDGSIPARREKKRLSAEVRSHMSAAQRERRRHERAARGFWGNRIK